jgi:hypothetical protein
VTDINVVNLIREKELFIREVLLADLWQKRGFSFYQEIIRVGFFQVSGEHRIRSLFIVYSRFA